MKIITGEGEGKKTKSQFLPSTTHLKQAKVVHKSERGETQHGHVARGRGKRIQKKGAKLIGTEKKIDPFKYGRALSLKAGEETQKREREKG